MRHFNLLIIILISFSTSAQINQGNLITKNKYFEIPYSDTKKEIRVKALIKGDTYDFMMDSGAPAFISSDIQKKYKFKRISRTQTKDAGGRIMNIDIVNIDSLQFGPFIFTDIPAIVFDLKNSPIACYNLAGNIGSNVLRHLIVQFNLQENNIAITDNEGLLKNKLATLQHIEIDQQSDVFFPIKLNGDLADTVHFDTGDGQLYTISKKSSVKYISQYPQDILRKGYGSSSMGIVGIGASFPQYIMKPGYINIDKDTIRGGIVEIAGNDKSRMGRELLNYGMLKLNYIDSTFAFVKYREPYKNNNYNYGFSPLIDGTKIIIGCVWDDTRAKAGGMKTGDVILKVNNTDFTTLPECDIETILKQQLHQNSSSISVTFRHQKEKSVTIILEKQIL